MTIKSSQITPWWRTGRTSGPLVAALLLGIGLLFAWTPAAHADVTPADLAGQPAIMKKDCRNRLGIAGSSLCNTDAAYAACVAYLKAGHWDYCLRAGEAGSQVRRSTTADARAKLLNLKCTELATGQFRCPDRDFNLSAGYDDCLAFRNGGSVTICLRRDFLREYADRIDAALQANPPVGYTFSVINSAGDRVDRAWGAARKAPDAFPEAMTPNAPYQLASVSKNIAAAATLRALADRGLSLDTPVWKYLPADWTYSTAFKTVTFRGLLRHRSGLYDAKGVRCDEAQKSVSYAAIKACAQSVTSTQYADSDCDKKPLPNADVIGCYQNLDYAFLRIAVPSLDMGQPAAAVMGVLDEKSRAQQYAKLYETYVNRTIFVPAGFTAQCSPSLGNHQPLVYSLKQPNAKGTDFGDNLLSCGGEGWVMSAPLLSQYLGALDAGRLISRDAVQSMKTALLGWEATVTQATPFGQSQRWWHGGCYNSSGFCNLSTLVMSYSNGVQLAVIFNSDFKNDNRSYGNDVTNAFYQTLTP